MSRRHILFTICSAALLAANSEALRSLLVLGRVDSTASHHLLVPLVTSTLICLDRELIFHSVPQRSIWMAVLIFLVGSSAPLLFGAASAAGINIALTARIAVLA